MYIDYMEIIISLISGIILGALACGYFFQRRHQAVQSALSAADATIIELRRQLLETQNIIEPLKKELSITSTEKTIAQTQLVAANVNIAEQRRILNDAKKELTDTFNALSASALRDSNQQFLTLAKETLKNLFSDTQDKLTQHKTSIDGLIKPLKETLKNYEEQYSQIEAKRRQDYGSLHEQIKQITIGNQQLQRETSNLVSALRKPQVKGRWGEMQLRRTVELAGMEEHCDFSVQQSIATENGAFRPDMIIHLPSNRDIVVDVKVSLEAYLELGSAQTEEERTIILKKHSRQVREHMKKLSQKTYWDQLKNLTKDRHTPEFVILFLPAESFYSSALQYDPELMEDSFANKIIIGTPSTLIALLKAVAYGWRQEQMTQNAEIISALGKDLYDKIRIFVNHFSRVGSKLNDAVTSYNEALGSMERRFIHSARRFKELGASTGDDVKAIEQLVQSARAPQNDMFEEEEK
jgi:DNA recombination protein RmuC